MVVWMGEVGGLDVGIYLALFFWVCGILGLVILVPVGFRGRLVIFWHGFRVQHLGVQKGRWSSGK